MHYIVTILRIVSSCLAMARGRQSTVEAESSSDAPSGRCAGAYSRQMVANGDGQLTWCRGWSGEFGEFGGESSKFGEFGD